MDRVLTWRASINDDEMAASGRKYRKATEDEAELDNSGEAANVVVAQPPSILDPPAPANPTPVSIPGSDGSRPLTAIEAARDEWLRSEGTSRYDTCHKVYADATFDYDFSKEEQEPLTCSGCKEQFDEEWEWTNHLNTRCGVKCKACDQPFLRLSELQNHRETSQTHKQILAGLRDEASSKMSM
jgi:hypothetical protein